MRYRNRRFNRLFPLLLAVGLLPVQAARAVDIMEESIQAQVVSHVLERLQPMVSVDARSQISVQVLKIPGAPFHFPNAAKLEQIDITLDSRLGEIYSDRAIVHVHLRSPDGLARMVGVPVVIQIQKPVWVAKNGIGAGQLLRPSDFVLQVRDVSHHYAYMVGPEKALNRYVARVNLQAGEVLDVRKMTIPPDVRYNDEVRIFLQSENGMTVSVPGIALGSARIGDIVRVRQSRFQRKSYTAKVIDKNRVLVEM